MNFEKLLEDKKIEKFIEKQKLDLSSAYKDIDVAKTLFSSEDYDWALNIAYNSVLRAARELMFSLGYRPIGREHHKNVFEFLRKLDLNQELIDYFDKIRIKRNKNVYGDSEDLSKSAVKEIISKAEDFVLIIRTFVLENRTSNKNDNKEGVEE